MSYGQLPTTGVWCTCRSCHTSIGAMCSCSVEVARQPANDDHHETLHCLLSVCLSHNQLSEMKRYPFSTVQIHTTLATCCCSHPCSCLPLSPLTPACSCMLPHAVQHRQPAARPAPGPRPPRQQAAPLQPLRAPGPPKRPPPALEAKAQYSSLDAAPGAGAVFGAPAAAECVALRGAAAVAGVAAAGAGGGCRAAGEDCTTTVSGDGA